ncbi:MAG: hypothetical protein ACM3QX_00850 [Syntrophomonadaceae bacterium]
MAFRRTLGKLFLLAAILILQQNILFSQDLVETYSKFISKKYMYDEFKHEQLLKLLRAKSSLHPDLIYYYITYYNKLSESSSLQEQESNSFKGYLTSKENILIQKRNAWANRQIALIDTMKTDPALKNRAENIFRELITGLIDVSSFPQIADSSINERLLNYFSAAFYNPESFPEYHSDLSYSGYKMQEEVRLREKIITLFGASERKHPNSNAELISLILDRWYLFDTLTVDRSKYTEPGEMILKLLKQNYSVLKQPKFRLGILYSPLNNACYLKTSIFIKGLERAQEFELKNSIKQLGLSLGYNYYIKEVMGLFSSINFQLLYFKSISTQEISSQTGFENDYTLNAIKYHDGLKFGKNILKPNSVQSYYLKITTPVLFFLNTVSLELGAFAGLNKMDYKYSYSYSYVKTETYMTGSMWEQKWYTHTVAAGADSKEYESSVNDFIISPVLELSVNPMEIVKMGFALSPQYSSFFFNYEF